MSEKSRISRVITRTGDAGQTGLADGSRVKKSDPRMHAIGDIDELNAHVGLLIALIRDAADIKSIVQDLQWLQHRLFDVGGSLALPDTALDCEAFTERLEVQAKALNESLPPLREFVLPGPDQAAAQAHVARTVCRRAERALVELLASGGADSRIAFINRVSDYLFIAARLLARRTGREVTWQRDA